ncbi:hypothetical protein HYX14_01675 [Candidatus Woesearchaeota archaeon]|nr:hypothetical protein [Candidatus Woesearchaeota archaeon]
MKKFLKKGIVLDFLVTVVLAIFIFGFATALVSKFLRLSEQAEENFSEFAIDIRSLAAAPTQEPEERKTTRLILDKETAVVYLQPHKPFVEVDVDGFAARDYTVRIERPSVCALEERCFCLVQDSDVESADGVYTVHPTKFSCEQIATDLVMLNCGIGTSHEVNAYLCSDGFVIERLLFSDIRGTLPDAQYEAPRRNVLQMAKESRQIFLEAR